MCLTSQVLPDFCKLHSFTQAELHLNNVNQNQYFTPLNYTCINVFSLNKIKIQVHYNIYIYIMFQHQRHAVRVFEGKCWCTLSDLFKGLIIEKLIERKLAHTPFL